VVLFYIISMKISSCFHSFSVVIRTMHLLGYIYKTDPYVCEWLQFEPPVQRIVKKKRWPSRIFFLQWADGSYRRVLLLPCSLTAVKTRNWLFLDVFRSAVKQTIYHKTSVVTGFTPLKVHDEIFSLGFSDVVPRDDMSAQRTILLLLYTLVWEADRITY
jgi:hypothetical protein